MSNGRRRRPAQGRPTGQASSRDGSGGRGSPARRRPSDADFWGRSSESPPEPVAKITPATDPAALPRSLGDPPLGPNPAAAAHHLAVIYEEAVRAGTALAAASGLVAEVDLPSEDPPA
ncbi:MAG: hypothetical protein ACRD0C_04260 [Acidimicrobiia bacterium]